MGGPRVGRRLALVDGDSATLACNPPDHVVGDAELLGDVPVEPALDVYRVGDADHLVGGQVAVPPAPALVAEASFSRFAPLQLLSQLALPPIPSDQAPVEHLN